MNIKWTLPKHRQWGPASTTAFRVLPPSRTHNGLENQRTIHFPRGKRPGSPKLPGTWAYMAPPEAFSSARCPSLEASSGLITEPGGRATRRTPRYEQNWATSLVGIVGNELHSGHMVLSFRKEELAQSRWLTVQDERALSDPCSPFCSHKETLLRCWGALEARSLGRSSRTPAQSLEPGNQFET